MGDIANAASIGAVYGALHEMWKVPAQGLGEQLNVRTVGTSALKNSMHFAMMGALYYHDCLSRDDGESTIISVCVVHL